MDAEDALARIESTVVRIDEGIPDLEQAGDPNGQLERLENLRTKLVGMSETISNRGLVSAKQQAALNSFCRNAESILDALEVESADEDEDVD